MSDRPYHNYAPSEGQTLEEIRKVREAAERIAKEHPFHKHATKDEWIDLSQDIWNSFTKYRAHLDHCEIDMTEFCTCGLKQTRGNLHQRITDLLDKDKI